MKRDRRTSNRHPRLFCIPTFHADSEVPIGTKCFMFMDKKFFFNVMAVVIAAIQCVVFSSCGNDDSEDLSLSVSPSSVTLHYDETVQLRVSGNADSWESEH